MGMDIKFMAVAKCKSQLEILKDYIEELYERDSSPENSEHNMCGYQNVVTEVGDWAVLCGEFRNCYASDLGYWCRKEGKDSLLNEVMFFEDRQDNGWVFMASGKDDEESGMLGNYHKLYDRWEDNPIVVDSVVPEELHETVIAYF